MMPSTIPAMPITLAQAAREGEAAFLQGQRVEQRDTSASVYGAADEPSLKCCGSTWCKMTRKKGRRSIDAWR